MERIWRGEQAHGVEGYLYHSYGDEKHLRHAVASVITLRRYDQSRPVVLASTRSHIKSLKSSGLDVLFDELITLAPEHCSITGFKHHLHIYMPFERTLFLDSDLVWCKDPDSLWTSFSVYPFTITGLEVSDNFFGASKHIGVLADILLQRRKRTLRQFGLSHLPRVQSGMIYAGDLHLTRTVCLQAAEYFQRRGETHFHSRLQESGRTEESCEWSMAMAMARLELPVYPWLLGENSPQLDFIDHYTEYDCDFRTVSSLYYGDRFVYSFRGLQAEWLRRFLVSLFSLVPGKGDHQWVTPYALHFGWLHQKHVYSRFADRTWHELREKQGSPLPNYLINPS